MKNTLNLKMIKNQRGLTLIEAAMVLAISTLVVAGTLMFYGNANENRAIKTTSEHIVQIVGILDGLSKTSTNFNNITEVNAAINSILSVAAQNTNRSNPFKNPYVISAIAPATANGVINSYQIGVKIPKNACGRMGALTVPSINK